MTLEPILEETNMRKESRTVCYDEDLRIEAYHLAGVVQAFPNHFHEYYVIGYMEDGQRHLITKNKEYAVNKGDIILFNPGDNHACSQRGERALDYRGINITKQVMSDLVGEVTGKKELPWFLVNVIYDEEITCYLQALFKMITDASGEIEKEEYLLLLIGHIVEKYSQPFESCIPECQKEIEEVCNYIEEHYSEYIYLDQLCKCANLSKSTLLRAFTKSKGVTPYRYLQTVRVNKAKYLLEKGVPPIEVAMQTGFSDQSHFTNSFNMFIGLTPGVYREIFLDRVNKLNVGV